MSKVGILSMQRIKNYGSFLQAYALKNMIEQLGHNVVFVDYRKEPPLVKNENKIKSILNSNASLYNKIKYVIYKKRFNRNLISLGINNNYNYTPKLDVLVIGSDEVFNCVQSNKNVGYSKELFGYNNNAKKIVTYAASFGNTTLEKLKKYKIDKEIGELLNNIDNISVRDENSYNIVKELTKKDIIYNLDPVLVYDFKSLYNRKIIKEKYILLYAYTNRMSITELKCIKKYAKDNNLKIYSIGGVHKYIDKFIDCNPFDILSYFNCAQVIITDTFHGSIFSIITKKKFVTLVRESKNDNYGNEEKLYHLLNTLNLKNRIITDIKSLQYVLNKDIDYKKTDYIISKEKIRTEEYLSNVLGRD